MSFQLKGENLNLMWYRKALWILLAHENPVEVDCRAKETQHGPYESKPLEQKDETHERTEQQQDL